MKKFSAAIFCTFYLAFSSGVVGRYHYCMNEFNSFKLAKSKADAGVKCGMHTKKSGCCHSKFKIVKLQDEQQSSVLNFKFLTSASITTPITFFREDLFNNNKRLTAKNPSPPLGEQDTYLFNCVFKI